MSKPVRILLYLLGGVAALPVLLILAAYAMSFHPDEVEAAPVVCPADAPELPATGPLRALNWNIQYMASTNYVFFYDLPGNAGPDNQPSLEDVHKTIPEVARIIKEENPDVVLLQEMQEDAVQSHHVDNLAELLKELGDAYPCRSEAFYWDASFVPMPQLMGSVDMKLVTLSKYKIDSATRHALPLIPADPISTQLGLKRAILETRLPRAGGKPAFVALNTHFSAFAQETDTLDRQVELAVNLLKSHEEADRPFILAGDFNMLPPDIDPNTLDENSAAFYNPTTEITPLFDAFPVAPSRAQSTGPARARYFTHIANYNKDNGVGADRTIDFYFYAKNLGLNNFRVRANDTGHISDHLPMIADFALP